MKSAEILHVFGPHFLGGELPEFFESIYKIDTGSDHVAKFRGDRPREFGDYALKKKKHHEHFIRPLVTPYGRPYNEKKRSYDANLRQAPAMSLLPVRLPTACQPVQPLAGC